MKRIIVFVFTLVFFLGLLVVNYPASNPALLDTRYLEAINKNRPQIVLLGDSMLGEGIDNNLFSKLIGIPTYKINWGGSASALWYLIIKNEIISATYKPKYILLFFRDTNLTDPTYRIDGDYGKALRLFSLPQEDILNTFAYYKNMNYVDIFLKSHFSPFTQKDKIKNALDNSIKYLFPKIIMGINSNQVDKAIDTIINDQNMDQELLTQSQLRFEVFDNSTSTNFDGQINTSFLPDMVRLTKKQGVELIPVRVKRRSVAEDGIESDNIKAYILKLNLYFDENNIHHLDYTYNSQIQIQHFGDGDHLNPEGKLLFTHLLAISIREIINNK